MEAPNEYQTYIFLEEYEKYQYFCDEKKNPYK